MLLPCSAPAWVVRALAILFTVALLITGCTRPTAGLPTSEPSVSQSGLPTIVESINLPATDTPISPSPTPSATQASGPVRPVLWISPALPEAVRKAVKVPAGVRITADRGLANVFLEGAEAGKSPVSEQWVYALVAPFPTAVDGFDFVGLQYLWETGSGLYQGKPLLMTAETKAQLDSVWGLPAANSVRIVQDKALLDTAWKEQTALAIIPFEKIEPRWKVLRIDGISPLDKTFNTYPLAFRLAFTGEVQAYQAAGGDVHAPTNRDPDKLTVLSMTGVTAISRQVAERMESKGMTYPASEIVSWLADSDLTHISNEVSFYKDCPKPGPGRRDMRFCSRPEYIKLLEFVGTDIVELTGNHNLDWGLQPYLDTLAMYRERGWKIYGGGANLKDSLKPLLIEHNGSKLAFLGCSPAGPNDVWATQYMPGSAPCDLDKLEQTVRALREQGYLPIVTFQHVETDGYVPATAQGRPDFRRMAAAGAVIVSGSQSHYAQTMTFVNDSFVHYGLGNLFFDQMEPEEIRPAFIDRHVFYDGRYLGVELLTSRLEDYALQRPMTPSERFFFLQTIFDLCSWREE
jgi:poly-gamma-glutamate synthesis protein (capsule biosynthesis protein)